MKDGLRPVIGQLQIREANLEEAQLLTDLAMESKASWGYSKEFMKSCRGELTISRTKLLAAEFDFFVAQAKQGVVGFYGLKRLSETEFELEALFVRPSFSGLGVGMSLLSHAKRRVAACGGQSIFIQGDPNAEKFYLAAGAQRAGESESLSIPGRYLPNLLITSFD